MQIYYQLELNELSIKNRDHFCNVLAKFSQYYNGQTQLKTSRCASFYISRAHLYIELEMCFHLT